VNDLIRQCPRCGQAHCDHDERRVANALASVGTGVTNIDVTAQYRWVCSLRRYRRTAFNELKQHGESMALGQLIALLDLCGTLRTESGYEFEQRSFLWEREGEGFRISTFWKRGTTREAPQLWPLIRAASEMDCAAIVADWMRSGRVVYELT